MRLIIATEAHFIRTPDGHVYSDTGGRGYSFWSRYLEVFDHVTLVARVSRSPVPGAALVEGERLKLLELPGYRGLKGYLRHRERIRRQIQTAYVPGMACIARVPGAVGSLLIREAVQNRRAYGLEVVGDPRDAFSPGAVRHPLRRLFQWRFTAEMRAQCRTADAVAYVTKEHLQRRYPTSPKAFVTNFSSVELPASALAHEPRVLRSAPRVATLIHVGTQSQWYKGHDLLLDAVATCVKEGLDLNLRLVGDGRFRRNLERRTEALELTGRVTFLGQLPSGNAVREQLDRADLFVMPSRTEGLPRAMIEAMARALPCIGSDVGGIPELLAPEDLTPPGDAQALASAISAALRSPGRLSRMSARNLRKAQQYRTESLRAKRIAFYEALKLRTFSGSEERDGSER